MQPQTNTQRDETRPRTWRAIKKRGTENTTQERQDIVQSHIGGRRHVVSNVHTDAMRSAVQHRRKNILVKYIIQRGVRKEKTSDLTFSACAEIAA